MSGGARIDHDGREVRLDHERACQGQALGDGLEPVDIGIHPSRAEEADRSGRQLRGPLVQSEAARLIRTDLAANFRVPADGLDPREPIADGEHLLVHLVEVVHQHIDVPHLVERVLAKRHLDFPGLVGVSRLGRPLDRGAGGSLPRAGRERVAVGLETQQHRVDARPIERVAVGVEHRLVLRRQVRQERPRGRKRGAGLRDQDATAAEPASDRHAVEASRPATCHEGGLGGIDTLIDRDVHDRLNHVLGRERHDAGRRLVDAAPQRLSDAPSYRLQRAVLVERHLAPEEESRVDESECDRRIGHRRTDTAAAVADRSRDSTGALRPDVEEAAGIDPSHGSTTRTDAPDVHRRHAGHVAPKGLAEPSLSAARDPVAAHERDIEGRAARIADDQRLGPVSRPVGPWPRPAPYWDRS